MGPDSRERVCPTAYSETQLAQVITFRQTKADRTSARRHLPEQDQDRDFLFDGNSLVNMTRRVLRHSCPFAK
jgi:hypothetical protein